VIPNVPYSGKSEKEEMPPPPKKHIMYKKTAAPLLFIKVIMLAVTM